MQWTINYPIDPIINDIRSLNPLLIHLLYSYRPSVPPISTNALLKKQSQTRRDTANESRGVPKTWAGCEKGRYDCLCKANTFATPPCKEFWYDM